ncbi:uncharacterized protein V1518DRAFT_413788 [Limtongia smithiae]|uniref:uncharacterized protein n=1 Tax=Limtongia smithiae TaxID=1125753 RepID=UPI0034CE2423
MASVATIAATAASQPEKTSALLDLLSSAQTTSPSAMSSFLDAVLASASALGFVVCRPVVAAYVTALTSPAPNTPSATVADTESLLMHALDALQPVLVSYEDQDCMLRDKLASLFEAQSRSARAASVLRGIKLESGQRVIEDEYRVAVSVRILRNLLEDIDETDGAAADADDDEYMPPTQRVLYAEDIINKSASLVLKAGDDTAKLHFKLGQARVLEARRRFLEACLKYYELSKYTPPSSAVASGSASATVVSSATAGIDEDDKLMCLSAAISCALLAPAGPARNRMLASLDTDPRLGTSSYASASVTTTIPSQLPLERDMLDKLMHDNLLPRDDLCRYLRGAKRKIPHQHLASVPAANNPDYDPGSVLDRAVTEHNLLAASRLYTSISFSELAYVLGLSADSAAEGFAARMIQERRLRAVIDRVDRIISFNHNPEGTTHAAGLERYDNHILALCSHLEHVVALVQTSYPDLVLA